MVTMMVTIFHFVIAYLINMVIGFMSTILCQFVRFFSHCWPHSRSERRSYSHIQLYIFYCNVTRFACMAQKLASVFINNWFSNVCVLFYFQTFWLRMLPRFFVLFLKQNFGIADFCNIFLRSFLPPVVQVALAIKNRPFVGNVEFVLKQQLYKIIWLFVLVTMMTKIIHCLPWTFFFHLFAPARQSFAWQRFSANFRPSILLKYFSFEDSNLEKIFTFWNFFCLADIFDRVAIYYGWLCCIQIFRMCENTRGHWNSQENRVKDDTNFVWPDCSANDFWFV